MTTTIDRKPSRTALFTAMRRALAHLRYQDERFGPDNLALLFMPPMHRFFLRSKKMQERTWNKLAAAMPGMNEYIIARTAFFDRLFLDALQEHVPQIVLLGAGYDSRAFRFAEHNRDTIIFELDAPATQQRKVKCLRAAKVRFPTEIQYIPIDFATQSLAEALEHSGFSKRQRTLFLWEGVSYYLTREAVAAVLGFAGQSEHHDSLIAFDVCAYLEPGYEATVYGATEFLQSMQVYHTDEGLLFAPRNSEMEAILEECNLKLTDYLEVTDIEKRYLTDDQGTSTGKMLSLFRFVCAAPV